MRGDRGRAGAATPVDDRPMHRAGACAARDGDAVYHVLPVAPPDHDGGVAESRRQVAAGDATGQHRINHLAPGHAIGVETAFAIEIDARGGGLLGPETLHHDIGRTHRSEATRGRTPAGRVGHADVAADAPLRAVRHDRDRVVAAILHQCALNHQIGGPIGGVDAVRQAVTHGGSQDPAAMRVAEHDAGRGDALARCDGIHRDVLQDEILRAMRAPVAHPDAVSHVVAAADGGGTQYAQIGQAPAGAEAPQRLRPIRQSRQSCKPCPSNDTPSRSSGPSWR